jgi:hypothetical protein
LLGLVLLGVLLLLRIPFATDSLPLLSTELEKLWVGEKLNLDLKLYKEVFTEMGPLSAFMFKMIQSAFGNSFLATEIIASILIIIQTWYFVYIVNNRNLLNERNYIPGIIFLVLMHASFDFLKLSTSLMGNLFVMLALNAVLRHIDKRDAAGEDVLEAGMFLGIASLFDLSNSIFIVWALLSLFFFTSTSPRQFFLVILAFLLPIFLAYIIYVYRGSSDEFLSMYLFNFKPNFNFTWSALKDFFLVYFLPFVVGTLGVFRVFTGPRYNNFQNRAHQILLVFGIFSLLTLFISNDLYPSSILSLIIPIAFFCSGFFVHQRSVIIPEVFFILFASVILIPMYVGAKSNGSFSSTLSNYRVKNTGEENPYKGKRIFMTGEQINYFEGSAISTGYLSWNQAKADFENPDNALSLIHIYNNFKKDMPEVIIDNEKLMDKVFKNLPELGKKYKKEKGEVYVLIK